MTNNTEQINNVDQQALRRKLLRWGGLGSVALLFAGFKLRNPFSKKDVIACAPEQKTIKMLTQDGKLVEVDASKISGANGKKITDDQLKNWVNTKQS